MEGPTETERERNQKTSLREPLLIPHLFSINRYPPLFISYLLFFKERLWPDRKLIDDQKIPNLLSIPSWFDRIPSRKVSLTNNS
jgi:hypothetical protein